jgi:hypothetical protein
MLLKNIVKYNEKQLEKVNGDQTKAENLITFNFKDTSIYNPFLDETMRNEVQPTQYYGLDNIDKMIKQYKENQQ